MRLRHLSVALAIMCVLAVAPAGAATPEKLETSVADQTVIIYLYIPPGVGPFPLLVMSHGTPRHMVGGQAHYDESELAKQASALSSIGAAVALVIRRGYGGIGHWADDYGGCENADFYRAGISGAQDIEAAIRAMEKEPRIDFSRVALIGVSAGGWASVAAGATGRFSGVISFAGGRGSRGHDDVCGQENLVATARRFGSTSEAPELWIYSQNDHFFGPVLAARLHAAFVDGGGHAQLLMVPAYGRDGHRYFNNVIAWMPTVQEFLHQIGFLR